MVDYFAFGLALAVTGYISSADDDGRQFWPCHGHGFSALAAYLDSLRKLQALDLRYLAPGHGGVMDEPFEEIERLIAHRLMREEKVMDGLEKLGECSIDELVLTVYDDVAEHLIPWAKKTMLAHLI